MMVNEAVNKYQWDGYFDLTDHMKDNTTTEPTLREEGYFVGHSGIGAGGSFGIIDAGITDGFEYQDDTV